jgi:hypothetical protein
VKAYLFSIIWNDIVTLDHHTLRVNETTLRLSSTACPRLSSTLCPLFIVPRASTNPPIPCSICEIRHPRDESRPAHCPVRSLLSQDLIIPLEMQIKVPLQRLISDESLPAHATLEFHRFIHFSYRVDVEPKKGLVFVKRFECYE